MERKQNQRQVKDDLYIGTYNVRTLAESHHLESLLHELNLIKWDVIGLAEVRCPGRGMVDVGDGHVLMYQGPDARKINGIGFLVKSSLKERIVKFRPKSDRIACLTLKLSSLHKISIFQVYAPTSLSSQENIDKFYDDLREAIAEDKQQFNMVIGDFNSKVGKGKEACFGNYGLGERNERGEHLVNFALEQNMKIANTLFKKRSGRMWTWRSPNLTTKNMIDYILTDFPKYFKDVSVLNRLNTGSDHRLVRAKINVRLQEERKKIFQKAIVQKQLDPAAKSKFRIDLRKEFEQQKSNSSTNDINKLNDKLMETLVKKGSTIYREAMQAKNLQVFRNHTRNDEEEKTIWST